MNPLGLALKYLDYMFECVTGLLSPNLSGWKLKAAASDHCHRIQSRDLSSLLKPRASPVALAGSNIYPLKK